MAHPDPSSSDDALDADPRPTRGLDPSRLTHLVGYTVTRVALEMKRSFAQHLGPMQLKEVEFSILVLVASNRRVNQKQLGTALDLSPPALAITLDRMVERGWVERVRSTEDRRSQIVVLTPEGRRLVDDAERTNAELEDKLLRGLSTAERLMLVELLMKVQRGCAAARK